MKGMILKALTETLKLRADDEDHGVIMVQKAQLPAASRGECRGEFIAGWARLHDSRIGVGSVVNRGTQRSTPPR
jgi:hypothetical protein